MSKSDTWENGLLLLELNNVAFAGLGDPGGLQPSAVPGDVYLSLHTSDPGEGGDQTTNECAYTNYARISVPRSGAGWTVTGNTATNAATVAFPQSGGSPETATHFGIGTDPSGTGKLLRFAALDAPLLIGNLVVPTFAAGDLDITED